MKMEFNCATQKVIVWDLFGGGSNSVYKALDKNKYCVYTFDVTVPTRKMHFKLDLSQNINILKKYFINLKNKPDIIVASPLCQSFSSIRSMKGGGTCGWAIQNNKVVLRKKKDFEEKKSGFSKYQQFKTVNYIAKLGKKCIDNTISLINFFKPKWWYIENPRNSLMWKYIETNHNSFWNKSYINKTNYGEYNYPTLKPTIFLSNKKIFLNYTSGFHTKQNRIAQAKRMQIKKMTGIDIGLKCGGFSQIKKSNSMKTKLVSEQICEVGKISSIPKKLILDIFNFFKE